MNNLNERVTALAALANAPVGGISPTDRAILDECAAFFGVVPPKATA